MASNVDNEDVLYRLACECEDVFDQLQEASSNAKAKAVNIELCAELQQRFSIWAAYLGVFAQESQCLDTRLRNFPDLQDLVARLLDLLRCSLLQYEDEINSQGEGDQALIGFDESPPGASPTPSAALTAIDNTLDRLNRLGVTIRQTSHDKIDMRAEKSAAGLDLASFVYLCIHAIQTLYPGAHRSLKDYLKESMINRYKRMLHHNSRSTQLKTPRKPYKRLPTIPEVPYNELQTDVSNVLPAKATPIANLQAVHTTPSQSGLSSVNIQQIRSRHKPPDEASTRFHKTSSVQVNQGNYPRLPITNGDSNIFTCEWCSEPLNKKILSESEWRRHINRDLKPYVCVSEVCSQAHPTYPTFDEWCGHMGHHNRQWYQQVYSSSTWVHVCTLCESNHGFYASQQDLYSHLKNSHGSNFTNEQLQVISRQSKIKQPKAWNECFLCCFEVEEQGDQGKVAFLKRRKGLLKQETFKSARKTYAMRHPSHPSSDPDLSDTSSNPDIDSHRHISQQIEDRSKAMARHVAGHLQVLMLLTLRFAALQKDDETLMDDDVKSDSVDIDDASDASKGNDLGSLSDIDSRADITLKDMDDVDNEGDAMDVDDDVGKDDVIIPDTDLELVYIPRQYDGLATEDDDFLQKVIESGAYQSRQGEHEHSASHPGTDYTIGWICALPIEYVAAQAFLDEKHEGAEYVPPNDNNDYTLGRIGRHNLVIAMLRYDEYGVSSAAGVARDMLHTFPQIKLVLMVGIGGGAPSSRHDIRLGDVVVGVPKDGMSGVIQYDFGKVMQGQGFQEAEFLNPPPMLLRTAVSGLRSQYESHGNQILEEVERVLEKRPRLRMKFARPKITTDRLYRSHVLHPPNNETDCAVACGDDPSNLVRRSNRNEDDEEDQAIHYGLIASANRLMRDASVRDELAKKGVLCFEMEAAGLMNNFPCLVIRGICDYADSHINKTWQGYAAMAAAAYARDLLSRIPPKRVEAEKKISDILPGPYEGSQQHSPHLADSRWNMAEEPQDFTENQLGTQEDLANERLSEKDRECHQLFRLTSGNKDTTYEWYKEQVEIRVKDTCLWFLNHEYYQEWLNQESGLLLITADPGCGKSVLAKYLIDHGLPRSATICYFFFKDQDQNTSNQALCALLHQLFSQQPLLIKHATPHFDKEGQDLINSTQSLWNILQKATRDPEAGSTIMVLDALDECAEPEFADLVRNMESQFQSDYLSSSKNKLKYLLTCRPYEQITSQFRGLLQHSPNVHIQGEEESEIISLEVQNVITHRIKQLSEKGKFPTGILNYLERTLQETTHRTYLWVYLVFNYLEENHLFTRTQKEVELIIQTHPKSVTEAFEKILNKSENEYLVRKALSIILAANRPLTVSEMNIAMNINDTAQDDTTNTFDGLDSEDQGSFKSRLRSLCGLFISVDHGKVYFLDEAAREFLLADLASPTDTPSGLHWHHSITTRQAHNVLAELCVLYLNLFNSGISARTRAHWATSYDYKAFLKYSAENWGAHFRQAWVADDAAIVPFAKRICDLNSTGYLAWSETYWKTSVMAIDGNLTDLIIASYYGHHAVVKLLVEEGADIEAKDGDGQTPLLWAAIVGHETVVKLLVEKGADIEVEDNFGQTPLSRAAENGHEAIVQLLAEKGAGIEAEREDCLAPILWAAMAGHEAVVKLLIEQGADIEVKDEDGQTPLSWAAVAGHEAVVKLLVEKGANIEAKDGDGRTPLLQAAEYGRLAIVTLLVEKGADVKVKDDLGQTPLMQAAGNGYKAIVKLLIEEGTDIEVKDNFGQTALSRAAGFRYRAIGKLLVEKLLVEKEIDIEAKEDKSG